MVKSYDVENIRHIDVRQVDENKWNENIGTY